MTYVPFKFLLRFTIFLNGIKCNEISMKIVNASNYPMSIGNILGITVKENK